MLLCVGVVGVVVVGSVIVVAVVANLVVVAGPEHPPIHQEQKATPGPLRRPQQVPASACFSLPLPAFGCPCLLLPASACAASVASRRCMGALGKLAATPQNAT